MTQNESYNQDIINDAKRVNGRCEMRQWLIQIRILKGYTQQEVANLAGISRSYYSGIEVGTRNAPAKTAKKIAGVLGFDWTLFFEEKGRETSQKNKTA
jgi:putative transcriptional regulator